MYLFQQLIYSSNKYYVFIPGIPLVVPNVTAVLKVNGSIVSHRLSWGEPFNNYDPILYYTVSCSGDVTCPLTFATTDNTTRSYTITNLTPLTTYTFSVVAINRVGRGNAGVVMITAPGEINLYQYIAMYSHI